MITDLTDKIEKVLQDVPDSRNDDIILTLEIWRRYYSNFLYTAKDGNMYVKLDNIKFLPREDHIKRIRAKIQNEYFKYLPTKISVAEQRKMNIEKWRQYART